MAAGEPSSGTGRVLGVVALDPPCAAGQVDHHGHGAGDLGRIPSDVPARRIDDLPKAPDPLGPVAEVGEPAVPRVRIRHREPQHPRPVRPDEQRQPARPRSAWQQLAVARGVEPSLEINGAVTQQAADDRERLLEAVDPVVVRVAERPELGLVPAGPEAEHQPASADLVDGHRLLGEQRRVVEARAGDERAELHPARDRGDRREGRPRLPRPARLAIRPAIEQVLAEPDRVEPEVLDRPDHVEQLRPAHLPLDLGKLDADLEGTHGVEPSSRRRPGRSYSPRRRRCAGTGSAAASRLRSAIAYVVVRWCVSRYTR